MPSEDVARVPQSRRGRRRRRWIWFTIGGLGLLVVLLLALVSAVPLSSSVLRDKIVATLSDRLDSEVEINDLHVRALPRFHADIFGLTVRHRHRRDVAPLIAVEKLSVDAGLLNLLRKHVGEVKLTGLQISIPPGRDERNDQEKDAAPRSSLERSQRDAKDVVIDQLIATDAKLVIIPGKEDKPSKVWNIHELHMQSVSFDRHMPFDAALRNAVPPGEIKVQGSFGPWQSEEPGKTTLEGTFTFADADLGIFKGIAGNLAAHGEFGGSLGRLGVHGETDTPNFTVTVSGNPVPLHADYHTTVDGTNGDTLLDRIDASFLNTSLVAKGSVIDSPGKKGRTVTLDVVMDKARIEDVLRLAVKGTKPPMTGAMKLRTKFVIPPEDRDIIEKLRLDGQFAIATAKFTNINVQQKVEELSRRGGGKTAELKDPRSVVSNFGGRFKLGGGTLELQTLTFDTPGASVQLAGTYRIKPQLLSFKGMLLLDAKMSETQKGWKRFLLKPLDPIFAKKGGEGTAIPIKIEGKRSEPSFGLDRGRLFRRGG